MSTAQEPSPINRTQPLTMVPAFEAALNARGIPPVLSAEIGHVVDAAAKKVPPWILWLILFFGGPFMLTVYNQSRVIWDMPQRLDNIEEVQQTQGNQLDRIEDNLNPTSRPK